MIPLFEQFDNYNIVNSTHQFKEHLSRTQLPEGLLQAVYKLWCPSSGNLLPFLTYKVFTSKPTANKLKGKTDKFNKNMILYVCGIKRGMSTYCVQVSKEICHCSWN